MQRTLSTGGKEHLSRRREGWQLEGLSCKHAEAPQLLYAELCEGLVAAHLPLQLRCLHRQLLVGGACAARKRCLSRDLRGARRAL